MFKKIFFLMILLIFLTGCGLWSKVTYVWQGKFLKVDINTSKHRWKLSKEDELLADLFYNIDQELELILVGLNRFGEKNFMDNASKLRSNKRWLAGCYLLFENNKEITIAKSFGNSFPLAPENVKSIFGKNSKNLTYVVLPNSQVVLIKKERKDENKSFYVALLVNFKELVAAKGNLLKPFAVMSLNRPIFTNGVDVVELRQINFAEIIKKEVKGYIKLNRVDFYWAARYIGDKPLFYLIKM